MFTIYGGKTEFEQWDLDQLVSNPCMKEGNEVVFRNSHGETYVTKAFKQGGEILTDVPNYLLQKHGNILVTLEQGADRHTECETIITVTAKDKPEDYKCGGNVKERKQADALTAANIASALGYTPLSSASGAVQTANLASGEQMTKTNVVKALGYTPATQTTVTNVIKNVSTISGKLDMKGNYYHWKGFLQASNWAANDNHGYAQTVEIYGITSSDTPHISLVHDNNYSEYSKWQAYKMISDAVVESDNNMLFVCYDECPSEDFTINVEWIRGN